MKILAFIILLYIINLSKEETSKIILTINGPGDKKILSDDFSHIPNEIYINNSPHEVNNNNVYYLSEEINNITIIWNYEITNCYRMFYKLPSITYIDLSHFNTASVTDMSNMFGRCDIVYEDNHYIFNYYSESSLISLNLNNFDTSKVTNMEGMFCACNSLISLNLNYFNTSLVTDMQGMFFACSSLKTLNLNNFNTSKVQNMNGMFWASSLISLNLNNFNTSLVINFGSMFRECSSLISLNINNFDTSNTNNVVAMFDGINSNLIICINETKASEILSQISSTFTKNCDNICFKNPHKLNKEEMKCIDYCSNDETYKYEYNNVCYMVCPDGTTNSLTNEYLCKNNNLIKDDIYNNIK